MPSHNRITKRQKKLIDLFGPENLKKDRVIEKSLQYYSEIAEPKKGHS